MEQEKEDKLNEILKKYSINLDKLEEEQKKLAKSLSIKDSMNFELVGRIAGIDNIFVKNRIISAIVVLSDSCEIIEQEYFEDKVRFPYIPGFRAYRELPAMMSVFNKLDEKPDLIFIRGHGILHPNGFGIASHFSLTSGIPAIGIADNLIVGEIKRENIMLDGKTAGKILNTKLGANPIYISPGNLISVGTAFELTKKFIKEPHKFPLPLTLAKKYAKEVAREILENKFSS